MKTTKLMTMMAVLMMALTLNSCLKSEGDDTNDQGLTKEQKHACFLKMAGEHSGKMYYQFREDGGTNVKTDSINVTWTVVNDSVITVHDIPTRTLSTFVQNKPLREALNAADNVEIKVYYDCYLESPITFVNYPVAVNSNIFYEESSHKATFGFTVNSYSWGSLENGKMRLQMILYGIYLDDQTTTSYLSTQVPLVFIETGGIEKIQN